MMTEAQLDALEAAARSWVGTPFCEGTPIKGAGVSCQHAAAEIYFEAQLIKRFPVPNGPTRYSAAQTRSLIVEWVQQSGLFVQVGGPPQPGDLLGFRVLNVVHHLMIALRGGRGVHCVSGHGVMILPSIPAAWAKRLEFIWRLRSPGS